MDRDVLVQAILDLENNRDENVTDPEVAYGLGHHVKDYIDRIVAIRDDIESPVSGTDFEREVFGNGETPGETDGDEEQVGAANARANGSDTGGGDTDDIATLGKEMNHPYALIPRLPRYLKGGQAVQASFVNMVRSFPQLFDNVAQTINKLQS